MKHISNICEDGGLVEDVLAYRLAEWLPTMAALLEDVRGKKRYTRRKKSGTEE